MQRRYTLKGKKAAREKMLTDKVATRPGMRDKKGPGRESNPGPPAPEAGIIPLDHQAAVVAGQNIIY